MGFARSAQVGEYDDSRYHTQRYFPVYCMADLAFNHMKRVHMLHGVSQSLGGENNSPSPQIVSEAVNMFLPCWTGQNKQAGSSWS